MKEKPQGKSPSAIGGSVQRSVRRRLAAEISMGIGRILGQSYEWHQGTWWLFTAGEPKRELRDYEVEWHVARRHKPFVPDGISQDDPHWWDEPPNVPDQRPGAADPRLSTRAPSPGSLHLACWACFSSKNSETPRLSVTLELLVAKIKQEMFLSIRLGANLDPVVGTLLKQKVAVHLVKLAPRGCEFAEPTLATIPTFVIYGTESILPAITEAKLADIFFLELWVKKRVQKEREHNIVLQVLHLRVRSIRLRIPVRI